jgi:tetraacyldisaccharide 4'-kinase
LDDGFSHLALARDLDLVVLPAADPFARGRLPPSGGLREPLAALSRADAVLLTGAPAREAAGELAAALRPYGFGGAAFASFSCLGPPQPIGSGGQLGPGASVLVVSGIARPGDFTRAVRGLGYEVAGELRFADHHRYPPASLARIAEEAKTCRADAVLTTSKDGVKLLGRLELPVFALPLRAEPEPAFWTWLDDRARLLTPLPAGDP